MLDITAEQLSREGIGQEQRLEFASVVAALRNTTMQSWASQASK